MRGCKKTPQFAHIQLKRDGVGIIIVKLTAFLRRISSELLEQNRFRILVPKLALRGGEIDTMIRKKISFRLWKSNHAPQIILFAYLELLPPSKQLEIIYAAQHCALEKFIMYSHFCALTLHFLLKKDGKYANKFL